jgi:TRAP-type C4-dicarboxylate transport system substrate-binding protein
MKGIKIRVPDVPAYRATPEACGANPTPIAFAEVYLALQNGTVEAQENPLTTIEAKKFYEVQKAIMLTGHIVDGLTTQVAPHLWNKLSDAEKTVVETQLLPEELKAKVISSLSTNIEGDNAQMQFEQRAKIADLMLKEKDIENKGKIVELQMQKNARM